jgi:HAMP domain-containing protein
MIRWATASIARATLLSLLLVAIVPIIVVAALFVTQSRQALVHQAESNLLLLARSKAEEVNLRLKEVRHQNEIAARKAEQLLQETVPPAEVDEHMRRYERDERGVLGLDVWYERGGGEPALGKNLSNVYFLPSGETPQSVRDQIVRSAEIDTIFSGIRSVNEDTVWIYLTTTDGMMRIYPWGSNDIYPDGWDPRDKDFYKVAALDNPNRETRWTPAYVDYAGAGWMVTVSTPLHAQDGTFLGVMSHDITIDTLQQIAFTITVLDGDGYGFIIDRQGKVIAHPDYLLDNSPQGDLSQENLLEKGQPDYQALISQMSAGSSATGYFRDPVTGEEMLLAFAPINTNGWSLGVAVPQRIVVQPANQMRVNAILAAMVVIGLAALLAVVLSRQIHRPLQQLLTGVRQVSERDHADEITVSTFNEIATLAAAFNEMAAKVYQRVETLKTTVAELRIEIDQQKKAKQVAEITDTDYFRDLQQNAAKLRRRGRSPLDALAEETPAAPVDAEKTQG